MYRLTRFLLISLTMVTFIFPTAVSNWAIAEYDTCEGKVVEIENPSLRSAAELKDNNDWLNRMDLICPLASATGPIEIMGCYAATKDTTFNQAQWQIRQYESVRLLVPILYDGIS